MKKLAILAILIGLFSTFSVSTQVKTPKNENTLTNEQKMLPFAMSMSLSVLGEMHDEQNLAVLTIFQQQIRYWSNELKPVVEMDQDTADSNRLDISLTATKALRSKSSDSDKWQMLVGEQFGTIYALIKKSRLSGDKINADDLKFNLELVSILSDKAPNDIPLNVNARFKAFGKLKDANNLTSDKNIQKIIDEVKNILNTISN